jgi:hypothetical protein
MGRCIRQGAQSAGSFSRCEEPGLQQGLLRKVDRRPGSPAGVPCSCLMRSGVCGGLLRSGVCGSGRGGGCGGGSLCWLHVPQLGPRHDLV